MLINTYRSPTELLIDGSAIYSEEGTIQGDPLSMPMYALAIIPLIQKLKSSNAGVSQTWYADDACASGKIFNLREWWNQISDVGPMYGYFVNPTKTWLVTKDHHLRAALESFANTGVQVTSEGRPYLGAAIGSQEYVEKYVNEKVEKLRIELEKLVTIANTQAHAAYSAYTQSLSRKWSFLARTIKGIGPLLQPLELTLRSKLIPALTGQQPVSDEIRNLLGLPCKLGGIALPNPVTTAEVEFNASLKITTPLTNTIMEQLFDYPYEVSCSQLDAKRSVNKERHEISKQSADNIRGTLPITLQHSMDLAQETGASNWLTTQPIQEHGFTLHKRAFYDAIALRYSWKPLSTPSNCACGIAFSIEHSLSCPKGGFPSLRHNEIRDLTANLLAEICSDVCIEPDLLPVEGDFLDARSANNQDGARLDIAANGFWGSRYERTFFDVRVFNPHALSNRHSRCYRKHELEKKRHYEQRVREVEQASFTPL